MISHNQWILTWLGWICGRDFTFRQHIFKGSLLQCTPVAWYPGGLGTKMRQPNLYNRYIHVRPVDVLYGICCGRAVSAQGQYCWPYVWVIHYQISFSSFSPSSVRSGTTGLVQHGWLRDFLYSVSPASLKIKREPRIDAWWWVWERNMKAAVSSYLRACHSLCSQVKSTKLWSTFISDKYGNVIRCSSVERTGGDIDIWSVFKGRVSSLTKLCQNVQQSLFGLRFWARGWLLSVWQGITTEGCF